MSANPIRLFVSHAWVENDDYTRVFEYLEASGTFYYFNTSQPQAKQPIDKESQREDLRRQIAPCEVLLFASHKVDTEGWLQSFTKSPGVGEFSPPLSPQCAQSISKARRLNDIPLHIEEVSMRLMDTSDVDWVPMWMD